MDWLPTTTAPYRIDLHGLVVRHLLAAANALLLGLGDEALVELDRVAVHAAELRVDHLHRGRDDVRRLREVEVRRPALAVDEAEHDGRETRVRLALAADVGRVVENGPAAVAATAAAVKTARPRLSAVTIASGRRPRAARR